LEQNQLWVLDGKDWFISNFHSRLNHPNNFYENIFIFNFPHLNSGARKIFLGRKTLEVNLHPFAPSNLHQ